MSKWRLKDLFWRVEEVEEELELDPALQPEPPASQMPNSGVATTAVRLASAGVGLVQQRAPLDEMLATLRDIQGVVGSIAVGPDGVVWGRDLPGIFDEDSTQRLATRVLQLHEALASDDSPLESGTLRYQSYHFHVSALHSQFGHSSAGSSQLGQPASTVVGVLADEHVNLPALRMGLRLVGRRLSAALGLSQSA